MKTRYIAAFSLLVAALQGCSSSSDIDMVKKGIMQYNKTLTVGEAFDRWNECQQRKWEEFKTENGRHVVQFTCPSKNVVAFMNKAKLILNDNGKKNYYNLVKSAWVFQWTINKDDTFQLAHVGSIWKWADGKTKEVNDSEGNALKSVYNNTVTFDMSAFNDPKSLKASKTALAYSMLIQQLYDSGN